AAVGITGAPTITTAIPAPAATPIAIVPAVVGVAVGMAPALAAIPGLPAVVRVAIDIAVLAIDHAVDVGALLRRDMAIGHGARLSAVDRTLAPLEAILFAAGVLPVANTALDTVLLAVLDSIDIVHRLRVCTAAGDHTARRQHGVRDKAKFGHRLLWAF